MSELIKPSRKTEARVERNSTIYHAVEPGVEKGEVDMNEGRASEVINSRRSGRMEESEKMEIFLRTFAVAQIFHTRDALENVLANVCLNKLQFLLTEISN